MTTPYENTVSSSSIMDLLDNATSLKIINKDIDFPNKSSLIDPETRINEKFLIDLWQLFEDNSNQEAYGLMLGQNIKATSKGPLASLVSQCRTLKDAFSTFIQYSDWMNPSLKWIQIEHDDAFELVVSMKEGKNYPNAAIEKCMSSTISWANYLASDDIKPISASFEFSKRPYHALFNTIFGDNLHFSSSKNAIFFSKEIFEKKLIGYNPYLKNILEDKLIDTIVKNKIKNIKNAIINIDSISDLILRFLPEYRANSEFICRHLSISRQTLYRELKKENTNFQKILDDIRKNKSEELFLKTDHTIHEISRKLGYIEIRSFYSAFNRWHQISASKFRKEIREKRLKSKVKKSYERYGSTSL